MAQMFLVAWWKDGKYHRGLRFSNLLALFNRLKLNRSENLHVYLHLGTIPKDANKKEIKRFMKDIQYLLKEKYNIEGATVELNEK